MRLELGIDSVRLTPESRLDSELLTRWQKRAGKVVVSGKDDAPTGSRNYDQLQLVVSFSELRWNIEDPK